MEKFRPLSVPNSTTGEPAVNRETPDVETSMVPDKVGLDRMSQQFECTGVNAAGYPILERRHAPDESAVTAESVATDRWRERLLAGTQELTDQQQRLLKAALVAVGVLLPSIPKDGTTSDNFVTEAVAFSSSAEPTIHSPNDTDAVKQLEAELADAVAGYVKNMETSAGVAAEIEGDLPAKHTLGETESEQPNSEQHAEIATSVVADRSEIEPEPRPADLMRPWYEAVARVSEAEGDVMVELVEQPVSKTDSTSRLTYIKEELEFLHEKENGEYVELPPAIAAHLRPLIVGQLLQESGLRDQAKSAAGAMGVAQFMPAAWQEATGTDAISTDFAEQIKALGSYYVILYQQFIAHTSSETLMEYEQQLGAEEYHKLISSILLGAYNAGAARWADAVSQFSDSIQLKEYHTAETFLADLVTFAYESNDGLLNRFGSEAASYPFLAAARQSTLEAALHERELATTVDSVTDRRT